MPVTEADWHAFQKEQTKGSSGRSTLTMEHWLKQTAIEASMLTNDPKWDRYLQRVQTLVIDAQRQRDAWQDALNRAFEERHRTHAQVELHRQLAVLDVLQQVMTFPKEILRDAAQAGHTTHSHG